METVLASPSPCSAVKFQWCEYGSFRFGSGAIRKSTGVPDAIVGGVNSDGSTGNATLARFRRATNGNEVKLSMRGPWPRSKKIPHPPRRTVGRRDSSRNRYAAPIRGATLSYRVEYIGVPGEATAIVAGSAD